MKPLDQCRLYTILDTAYLRGRNPADVARQLCEGGSDLVQLRAKNLTPAQVGDLAGQVLPILRAAGVGLVVNDHFDIARQVGAEFCHLGQEDFFENGAGKKPELARHPAGPGLGLSTHSPDQARRALAVRPSYIAIGPVYATPTKPGARPVTLEYVRWAAGHVSVPWFAIGGINLANLEAVLAAGARRVCVVSAVLNASDIVEVCRQFKNGLAKI
jgi:thiamine-phosphate pyrophosphorylase